MKMYKNDGKEHIPADKPSEVKLGEALRMLDKFPIVETHIADLFIGFVDESGKTIQFIRFGENEWLIDVPVVRDGQYVYSLQDELEHSQVKEVVTRFCQGKRWKSLCNLQKP